MSPIVNTTKRQASIRFALMDMVVSDLVSDNSLVRRKIFRVNLSAKVVSIFASNAAIKESLVNHCHGQ
jgi:hypothetical protein